MRDSEGLIYFSASGRAHLRYIRFRASPYGEAALGARRVYLPRRHFAIFHLLLLPARGARVTDRARAFERCMSR